MKRASLNLCISVMAVFLSFFPFVQTASSAIIHVKTDGSDAGSGASWSSAKQTVSAAIEAAGEGDEIWVAQGTYAEHIQNKATGDEPAVNGLYTAVLPARKPNATSAISMPMKPSWTAPIAASSSPSATWPTTALAWTALRSGPATASTAAASKL